MGPTKKPTRLGDPALRPDPRNANQGTPRGRRLLATSLTRYGAGRSVLVDRHGTLIAGNKTFEQARALGLSVKVVPTTGRELIAVKRTDLDLETDTAARALAIADNRVSEVDLAWDTEQLEALRRAGVDMTPWFTEAEFARLVGARDADDPSADVAVEPEATTVRRGALYALDSHRLLCGDATDAADVTQLLDGATPILMTTDPPYGVQYDPAWRHRAYPRQRTAVGRVANDSEADWAAAYALFPGDVAYAWHAARATATVATALESVGLALRAQIVWVKQHFALSRGDYHWQHEPCWYAVRRGATAHWQGDRTQTTVWSVPNLNSHGGRRDGDDAPTGHGTQKPVALFEIPIRNHTARGDAVYDPFCGSGTALIAAEKRGRTAYVMDIDPRYVQVTITRWEQYTGRPRSACAACAPGRGDDDGVTHAGAWRQRREGATPSRSASRSAGARPLRDGPIAGPDCLGPRSEPAGGLEDPAAP